MHLKDKTDEKCSSAIRRMRTLSPEERSKVMAHAAEALASYYRTDPEIQEWQSLETEDFCDIDI